ncbi:BTB/POZ domain-containing protein [Ditylenchus destructor]|nr:BTB/POZ domain-containing protein [Ditylenchus destructor]
MLRCRILKLVVDIGRMLRSARNAFVRETANRYPSDCVIECKDKKEVHVNKNLLSLYSEYWKDAFAKLKKGKALSLTNVDYDEFLELLSVIYPSGHPITAKNVETLSKLAYEFGMSELLKRCDIFLMASSEIFGKSKLLLLAQSYNLERLQAQCISEYKNIDDVKAIQKETDYAHLDCRTKRMLLDNIIGANSANLAPEIADALRDLAINEKNAAKIVEKLGSCPWLQSISCAPDIVLVVGNSRIPAHKQYLSMISDFFNNMFQSEFKESRESEITLEEVRHDEILELLSVIYPFDEYSINETNIAVIVKLADRFMMPIILERCKKELKNSDKIKGALKLWLAQQYGTLAELQKEFAYKYKSIEDVQKLKTEPEFDLLDDKMRALLLESITM